MPSDLAGLWDQLWAYVVTTFGGAIAGTVGLVRRNRKRSITAKETATQADERARENEERSERNERALYGTDDPNHEGALQTIQRVDRKVDHLEDKMDDHHSEVLERIDGG